MLAFADVTERVRAIAAQESRWLADAIVDAVSGPLLVLDGQCKVISANRAFHQDFGGEPVRAEGSSMFEIADRLWDVAAVHALLEAPWPTGSDSGHRVGEVSLQGGEVRLDARRIARKPGDREVVLLSISPANDAVPRGGGP